jgi:hypothetical protein
VQSQRTWDACQDGTAKQSAHAAVKEARGHVRMCQHVVCRSRLGGACTPESGVYRPKIMNSVARPMGPRWQSAAPHPMKKPAYMPSNSVFEAPYVAILAPLLTISWYASGGEAMGGCGAAV